MRSVLLSCLLFASVAAAADWPNFVPPSTPVGGGEKDVAIVVGVEDYLFVPDVAGAAGNADDWYLYFTRLRGTPPGRVHLLRNVEATKEALQTEAEWAATQAKPGGLVWFVFIGHGAPAKDGKDGVLIGVDAQQSANSLYARSLPQQELVKALAKGKQDRTVLVLDACFSGRGGDGTSIVPGLQPVIAVRALPPTGKVSVLSAGQADQFAGPLPGANRPAFSYLLLGALRGWGDDNHDGMVTGEEAVGYAQGALSALLKDRRQTPQLNGADPGVLSRRTNEKGPDIVSMVLGTKSGGGGGVASLPDRPPEQKDATVKFAGAVVDDSADAVLGTGLPGESDTVRAQRGACRKGNGDDCVRYGLAVERGEGTAKDVVRAAAVYDKACSLGSMHGCRNLGLLYAGGTGVDKNPARSIALYRQACAGGLKMACGDEGWALLFGVGTAVDDALAVKRLKAGCDADYSNACINLGWAYENGRASSVNGVAAAQYYRRACELDNMQGCGNLGLLFGDGRAGAPKNVEEAIRLHRKACDGNWARSCDDLARLMTPSAETLALYDRACQKGYGDGCVNAGYAREVASGTPRDYDRAAVDYQKGCDLGSLVGCRNLSLAYRYGRGLAVDFAKADKLLKDACDKGHPVSCYDVGSALMKETPIRTEEMLRAFSRACDGGYLDGCVNRGWAYEMGKGMEPNPAQAYVEYARACDAGSALGCNNMGLLLEKGRGTEKNDAAAFAAYTKACNQRHADGCNNYGRSYHDGRGVTRDYAKAREAYEIGCGANNADACWNLSILLKGEWGGPADPNRAAELVRKSCSLGRAASCGQ